MAAPGTITPADDGRTFTLRVGATTALVLDGPPGSDPQVQGSSVIVVLEVNVTGTDRQEWEVRAVAAGTSTIRGSSPDYVITINVT